MIFVQLFGGNAVGKSSILGLMQEKYGARMDVSILGRYTLGRVVRFYTGGLDAEKMTNVERFEAIRKAWLNSINKVVACEGMMTSYYSSFFEKYYELQKQLSRTVYAIYLYADEQERIRRVTERGKGKPMNPSRLDNIKGKAHGSKILYGKLLETESYRKLMFETTTPDDLAIATQEVDKIFSSCLGEPK